MEDIAKYTALLVEDNPDWVRFFNDTVVKSKLNIFNKILYTTSIAEATKILKENNVHLILLDLMLPDSQAGASIQWASKMSLPVVVMTTLADEKLMQLSLQAGIDDYLIKDEYNEALFYHVARTSIQRFIQNRRESNLMLKAQLQELCKKLEIIETALNSLEM